MSELRGSLLILGIVLAAGASAESRIDPTRPPAAMTGTGAAGANASEPRLTSILTRGEESFAVVDGQTLRVGDRVGERRVVAIDAGSVHLAKPDGKGRQIWALYRIPAVKQASAQGNVR